MLNRAASLRTRASGALVREDGFTLVELLAAMLSGIVIMLAAFAMVDLTIRDTNRVTDRVEATSLGRTSLEQLVGELSSGCLTPDVSPIMATSSTGITPSVTSDATHVVFVSGLGDGQSGNPTEHVLTYAANALTDRSYAYTGGTGATLTGPSTWTFATTPTTSHVLNNVTAFNLKYYSFPNTANATVNSLNGATALTTLSSVWPATSTEYNAALSVARVDIALTVGPSSGTTAQTVLTDLTDSVVFRVTPPSSIAINYPCD
jgi:Tfp pilus assembly protein PilW